MLRISIVLALVFWAQAQVLNMGIGKLCLTKPEVSQCKVTFTLYNRLVTNGLVLSDANLNKIIASQRIVFIIHGWLQASSQGWIVEMKNEYLKIENLNVIVVDWSTYAFCSDYWPSAEVVPEIGVITGDFIWKLVSKNHAKLNTIQINGFSLGAHVAGIAGQQVQLKSGGVKIERINGLDATSLGFDGAAFNRRLDASDAKFVQAFHTSDFGMQVRYGTIDVYFNVKDNTCGRVQPGCPFSPGVPLPANPILPIVFCNHIRAVVYFIYSIKKPLDTLLAIRCSCINFRAKMCVGAKIVVGEYCPSLFAKILSNDMHAPRNYRTLVIAERLPFDLERNEHGDLVRKNRFDKISTTVAREVDPDTLWLGWAGSHLSENEKIPEPRLTDPTVLKSSQILPFCSNLWGLFHLVTKYAVCDETKWKNYLNVNKAIGNQALEVLKKGETDVVWLHNYQVIMAAVIIRQAIVEEQFTCKMGFFLHTQFPPCDVIKLLPWCDELLQGMLANDVVGFHTLSHCQNFLRSCQHCLGCRVDEEHLLIEHGGRVVTVKPSTMGIPFDYFTQLTQPKSFPRAQKIITTFDKCPHAIAQKLSALELLFKNNPDHLENIIMLFVITRVSLDQIQDKIDRFNANYRTSSWYPVHCTHGNKTQSELVAILQTTDVCLITPLNSSLSLIAKEFVACQNTVPGVLLLSSFSGNAETMPEAITTNPNLVDELAQALNRALTMPDDEKTIRMNYLRERERRNNTQHWKNSFLDAVFNHTNTGIDEVDVDYFDKYLSGWIKPNNDVVLLLDYDGTLAPIMPHPNLSKIPKETKAVLERLSNTDGCYVAVISGRGISNVKGMVGMDHITYAGNHGLEILFPDGSNFVFPIPEGISERVADLDAVLQEKLGYDGSWVENKGTSLTFHYRDGTLDFRKGFEAKAKVLIEEAGFKSEHAHLAVEAKPIVPWNKGCAAVYILEKIYGTDWINKINVIYIGDDVTDEDAMLMLKGIAATIRITSLPMTKTMAERRLPNNKSVLPLLQWVEQYLSRR
ncbi:hypothetical protein RN001_010840 [Aquatica leii]|uniref:Lipase domain-containing protein n=1 Tax=Aquatica leii TaxID=1421715 RepID=A0AAN7P745_9COLE|nr:hypothetical protein RN001_010840 [Aquatica leii]